MLGKKVTVIGIILVLITLVSCDLFQGLLKEEGCGNLTIDLQKKRSTTILPECDTNSVSYSIDGTHPVGHSFHLTDLGEDALEIRNIPTGVWSLTVTGYNTEGFPVSSGTVQAEITTGMTTSVQVSMGYSEQLLEGSGRICYRVSWEQGVFDSPEVRWVLTPEGEGEVVTVTQRVFGNTVLFDREFSPGAYQLTMELFDETAVWKSSPFGVLVLNGLTSRNSYTLDGRRVHDRTACTIPDASCASGTFYEPISVTLNAAEGLSIRYTTDGSQPDSEHGILYQDAITVACTTELKAAAYFETDSSLCLSPVLERLYTFPGTLSPVQFSLASGLYDAELDIRLSTYTEDAVILYTLDGTDPGLHVGYEYASPIHIDMGEVVEVRAVVQKGEAFSPVMSHTFQVGERVADVVSSVASGVYRTTQVISLETTDPEAEIRYSLDGTYPGLEEGLAYSGPFEVVENRQILAAAFREGYLQSDILSLSIVLEPEQVIVSLPEGTYTDDQMVSMTCATESAMIRYTLDGTDPTAKHGIVYDPDAGLTVSRSSELKAAAFITGWAASEITARNYTMQCADVVITEVDAASGSSREADLSCDTSNVSYWYTTDSSDPVVSGNGQCAEDGSIPLGDFTYDIKVIAYRDGWEQSGTARLERDYLGLLDTGPSGGLIFYDDKVGWDSSGNGLIEEEEKDLLDGVHDGIISGRRYLEVAPAGWYPGESTDPHSEWGPHSRGTISPSVQYYAVGRGLQNSERIVSYLDTLVAEIAPGEFVTYYTNPELFLKDPCRNDGSVAAKYCLEAVINGFDDWFLPSWYELARLNQVVDNAGQGGFRPGVYYWSSTETGDNTAFALGFSQIPIDRTSADPIDNVYDRDYMKKDHAYVRPIRMF